MSNRAAISIFIVVTVLGATKSITVQAAENTFRAGAAKADITPQKWPLPMVGTFSRRLATRAWDPLHARGMVLDDGQSRIAIVVVDSCYVPRDVLDEAKTRAAALTGIRTDRMLISATHSHSAPASRDRREIKADSAYVEQVIGGIVKAVQVANENLEPAEIGWGVTRVPEELFNRRWFMKQGGIVANPFGQTNDVVRMNPPRGSALLDRPAGPIDPDLSVVSVRSTQGRPITLLANYSLHYVGGIAAGGVSADYFGEFARLMEQRLGSSDGDHPPFVGILSNGTSGDVNNINFRDPRPRAKSFERMRAVAQRVANAAQEVYETIEHRSNMTLGMAQRELTLQKRRPNPAQLQRAREVLAATDTSALHPRAKPYAQWTVQLSEPPYTEQLILQAIRIGQLGITAIPCEVFTEIGLDIKRKSPLARTFTIELANGHYGYLPTPRQHALGGYETWLGTCILEVDSSQKITAVLLELLEELSRDTASR